METPALYHLMGAYLHQDYHWTGTIEENIDLFVEGEPHLAPAVPDEIEQVLATYAEEELAAFVDGQGCEVLPPDGLTYRVWLTQIADRVRAATT